MDFEIDDLYGGADLVRTFSAGDLIFCEKDSGTGEMYIILSGNVEIFFDGISIEHLVPGDFFGEVSLIDSGPRAADAVAIDDCELAVVDQHEFKHLIQQRPDFALNVMSVMAKRMRTRLNVQK